MGATGLCIVYNLNTLSLSSVPNKILISIDFSVMLLLKDFSNDSSSSENHGFNLQNPAFIYVFHGFML